MKNLFAFGFLALALTVVSCGGTETTTDASADSLVNEIENVADSLENVADSVRSTGDSIADSLQNVQ